MPEKTFDLQTRLIDFAVNIIRFIHKSEKEIISKHIQNQIIRSGTSPAANYGEAQAAESKADFIHKMKIVLKELRETKVWLDIIRKAFLMNEEVLVNNLISENEELIAIVFTCIRTAVKKVY